MKIQTTLLYNTKQNQNSNLKYQNNHKQRSNPNHKKTTTKQQTNPSKYPTQQHSLTLTTTPKQPNQNQLINENPIQNKERPQTQPQSITKYKSNQHNLKNKTQATLLTNPHHDQLNNKP